MNSASGENTAVAVFCTQAKIEAAIGRLKVSGFDLSKISIAGKQLSDDGIVGIPLERQVSFRVPLPPALGLKDLLSGQACFSIPGIGKVFVVGPMASLMIAVLENALVFDGLSTFAASLYTIGIPLKSALCYESQIRKNKWILVACGTAAEMAKAKSIIRAVTEV